MIIKIISFVFLPLLVLLIMFASLSLGKAPYEIPLLLTGCLFIASFFLERPTVRFFIVQILMLGLFHWLSHLNWCYSLYLIVVTKILYRTEGMTKSLIISSVIIVEYTLIRLSYMPLNLYNITVTISDLLTSIVVVLFVRYMTSSEKEKIMLKIEKKHLSTHDELTGLLNYQEYHKRLNELIQMNKPFVLFIIDCNDFKTMNNEQGFQMGNQMLEKIAEVLSLTFSDAHIIARYGGDEFAVALKPNEHTLFEVQELLDKEIPNLLGLHMTYGYAYYLEDGSTKDDLISAAEHKLFVMKRESWIKREEHLFREEKLKVVGELAAGMAHEIRNPLTTIKGFLQMASQSDYNIKPFYEIIMNEISRMSELTAEFLQFSKPHVTNFKIHSLHDCIQRVLTLTESEAIRLGHQIEYEHESPPIMVYMDKDKIVQVILNMVRNAYEAMQENGTATIWLYKKENQGILEISDTGPGISPSELEQIFQPFFTTKESGTGLGLSICHKIIQDHGGTIEVNSTVNKGTTFIISFPSNG